MPGRKVRNQDFWSGIVFTGFGVATMVLSAAYPLGTASRMGPGYFPMLLGGALAAIGLVLLVASTRGEGRPVERLNLPVLARLLLSLVAFAVLLQPMGLLITGFVTVLLAAWAGPHFRLGEAVLAALALTVGSALVFVVALKQTLPLWPSATLLARIGL